MPVTLTPAHRRPFGASHVAGDRFADCEVAEIMTHGVVCISEDASLHDVQQAMLAWNVHAILAVGIHGGRPLGWITSRGLLGFVECERTLVRARDAVVEPPATIDPGASAAEALVALSQPGVSRLLVARGADRWPTGVVTDVDIIGLASR